MVSQTWGGLCGCRSEKRRGGVIHHGAGSTDGFLIPGCLTPWVLQQHLTSVAAASQPPMESPAHIKGVISSARVKCPLGTDI